MSAAGPVAGPAGLRAALAAVLAPPAVILGVGNRARGDDGFGPAVLAALRGRVAVPLVDGGPAPENHLQRIAALRPARVLIVDAAELGAAPGALHYCLPDALDDAGASTHAGSLALLARYLDGACGARCGLLLAQVQRRPAGPGAGLSPAGRAAVQRAVRLIRSACPAAPRSQASSSDVPPSDRP